MTMHSGITYSNGEVSLEAPNCTAIEDAVRRNSEDAEWRMWREQAALLDDIYYFSIHLNDVLVGELFLHDINLDARESLLGYRIFSGADRGRGIGSQALQLLQEYVARETDLERLAIITAVDNIASRRLAEHCGFEPVGPSREDPRLMVYEWKPSQCD